MKKLIVVCALLILSISQHTVAASNVDLRVSGLIVPTACTPLMPGGGLIDYGTISRQDLNVDRRTRLPVKHLQVNVTCHGPSRFALRMSDNRDGSALVNSEIYYGLGFDRQGTPLGVYSMVFDPKRTQVDNAAPIYGTESTTAGLAWRTANLNPIYIGARSYLGFTDSEGSTTGPTPIQTLSTTVDIEAVINATQNLDLNTDTRLDGSATLEVVYL
ncbi:DUF1120 domain-containing protein [Pseudomonas sp. T1.Ur]|uniref:DUF1120 domain-containing protein n=1 Tax=Pseudomonas sp. T1.Ur TaxID=2928704 RepID=UPI00201DBA8B|nr:DUF1120 domain-containing protein [Pseudomonas sp. T1.Ur]MCL6703642.1 DUF1120 domain-containing protein [Pseudomonas sp. T1.Ur]